VTNTIARKQWIRPELVRLGRIADVAGVLGTLIENGKHARS
jgi:hypothetical protein